MAFSVKKLQLAHLRGRWSSLESLTAMMNKCCATFIGEGVDDSSIERIRSALGRELDHVRASHAIEDYSLANLRVVNGVVEGAILIRRPLELEHP